MVRLFGVSIPISTVILILSDTVLLTLCYVAAAFLGLNQSLDPWFYLRYDNGWLQLLLVVGTIQAGLYMMDLYDNPGLRTSRILLIQQLCLVLGIAFLIQALIGYAQWEALQLPQWTMVYGSVLVLFVIPIWRILFFALVRRLLPRKKLVFLGASPAAREIVEHLEASPEIGFSVLGYVGSHSDYTKVPCLGDLDEMEAILERNRPDAVVMGHSHRSDDKLIGKLLSLKRHKTEVDDTSSLYESVFGRVSVRDLELSPQFPAQMGPGEWTARFQSAYSVGIGLVGLVLASPFIVIVAILVKLSSPGPVFYSQRRVGLYNKEFYLYKFRSMYIDAEARSGPVWATKNDPRITPIGRWLRLLRLDELPQFWNVVKGEMAVVGPRPERPEFCKVLEEKVPFYQQRHLVKPGITGWAQINHSYTDTIEDTVTKLEYDLYYVKHLDPALDAYIIFHTLKVMLLQRGAQ